MTNNRIHSLDYLRGIAASIVMVGHYYGWLTEPTPTPILLHKMVTFSVSIFYILSGITLYSVYHKSFEFNFKSFYSFAIKRVFRILPLLWMATTATIYIKQIYHLPLRIYFFNYTGLFGLITERDGIARAAWSIGNEMVFYLAFPFFILIAKQASKTIFTIYFLFTVAIAAFFTFSEMGTATKFSDHDFSFYIHPLNQLFLFVGGMLIAHLFTGKTVLYSKVILIVSVLAFLLFPVYDRMEMFIGIERFILCGICFVICTMLLTSNIFPSQLIHRPLKFIGDISYSIYLLHPIVYLVLSNKFYYNPIHPALLFSICIVATIIASFIVYKTIEQPAMKFGSYLSGGFFSKTGTKTV